MSPSMSIYIVHVAFLTLNFFSGATHILDAVAAVSLTILRNQPAQDEFLPFQLKFTLISREFNGSHACIF